MATFMTSAFTAPDRRKKAVTYGKSSRLTTIPAPAPALAPASNSDAPSPERPRKNTAFQNGLRKRQAEQTHGGALLGKSRAPNTSADIFDVPSEDELVLNMAKTSKKLLPMRRIPVEKKTAPKPKDRVPEPISNTINALPPSHKPKPMQAVASTVSKPPKATQPSKAAPAAVTPSEARVTMSKQRANPTQPSQALQKKYEGITPSAQRSSANSITIPQAKAPASAPSKATKNAKGSSALSVKKNAPVKASAKASRGVDVFDVPLSEDELNAPTPKPPHRVPPNLRNGPAKTTKVLSENRKEESIESSDSAAAKKRKRRGSVSSTAGPKQLDTQKAGLSLPQRSRKYPKQVSGSSPGLESAPSFAANVVRDTQHTLPVINKPRRTRTRTVPVLPRPPVTKGQSSPATLHSMLPDRKAPNLSPVVDVFEAMDEGTFYEIPDPIATPVRPSAKDSSGSVTPRQKALFGSLLRSSSSLTPMPSISKLQLTDSKPRSLLGALSRSKSDVAHSVHSKQVKLIANLKDVESSSDDDSSDSDSASGSESRPETHARGTNTDAYTAKKLLPTVDIASEDMDIDSSAPAVSQISQASSGFGNRSKFTYAKSRSYLQEENPEDAFFMSLDVDDPMVLGSQPKDSQTEDDEEASQARPKHELIRQGQNTEFQWTNAMFIDDISVTSSSSIRRSTLLELCTKMADEDFAHALLDSSLAHQFLTNIATEGEIIFNFAAAAAIVFMLRANPTYTTLDQVYRSGLAGLLSKLLDNDSDIQKIAKDRKTNLSKIARESVIAFRATIVSAWLWSPLKPDTVSPQLMALKALDSLIVGLREAKNLESIIDQDTLVKLVNIASTATEHCKLHTEDKDSKLIVRLVVSILEAVSLAKQKPLVWSARLLQMLAASLPVVFQCGEASTITMAVKFCMNLTNNKPKACQQFSKPDFVQSLVQSIVSSMKYLHAGLEDEQRTEVLDTLILSLGAMINLTEHSDEARLNIDDGKRLIESLVNTFVDGSARTTTVSYSNHANQILGTDAIQAASMQETQSSVAVGYLSVLLGNMCLNESAKKKIRAQLPGQQLTRLVDKIREFVQVHEQANRKSRQFEGEEGQETWQNYTARIMLVVKQLEEEAF
jgi:hypothetical protein